MIDRLWPIKNAAQMLGVSKRTLQRWIARGDIARVELTPQVICIRESQLVGFIERKSSQVLPNGKSREEIEA